MPRSKISSDSKRCYRPPEGPHLPGLPKRYAEIQTPAKHLHNLEKWLDTVSRLVLPVQLQCLEQFRLPCASSFYERLYELCGDRKDGGATGKHTTSAMASQLIPNSGASTVLVFGCQWLSFDANDFRRLRATILDTPDLHWMLDVLAELPQYYAAAAASQLAQMSSIPGEQQLRDLDRWFRCGDLSTACFPLSYVQLAPLMMMTHFTQYCQYLRLTHPEYVARGVIDTATKPVVEIVGFCIGFLSAAVASAAATGEQLQAFGAVAMRLAMLLGGLGDVQEAEEKYTSLAVMWKTSDLEHRLPELLHTHPGTYITVRYDENRVTIMTPQSGVASLCETLQTAGFSASPVELSGRYHWSGHQDTLPGLFTLCDADPGLQLPDAADLGRPPRANTDARPVSSGPLHRLVLRAVLVQRCLWFQTMSAVYQAHLIGSQSIVVEFGPERCIPPSFFRRLGPRVVHFADLDLQRDLDRDRALLARPVGDNDIAIVGMACRVAGADDLNDFWQLLCAGKSQHREMPPERYENYETPWRPDARVRPWLGNFVRDIDAFDNKFFKKSPREAMAQEPQQRLILQVAYQALEQSGYFFRPPASKNIGCYIASCTVDYEHNVNCHPASAYAATGLLRSFLAGKLSHHFGWRGPSVCVDTACSGSTVALHHACRAILNGDCDAALVGGANAITSPLAYDNLAGASFLSPMGPCKPFDEKADGYCRGEGFAAIVVKKLSGALENGDTILATIAGTAVEQNDNCTPIVVPDAASLAGLFKKVIQRARLHPRDITVVEAHGTGTAVGDPAEYRSVREVLGGPRRAGKLALGSVKGLVGHTEGVSGMVALVKSVLMIHEGQIPPQPGFCSLNPHIEAAADDHIEIGIQVRPWEAAFRAVLINNYGACGSNASVVVTQAPQRALEVSKGFHTEGLSLPFRLCALDEARLREYATCLRRFLSGFQGERASLANISYNAARQSNPSLECQSVFRVNSKVDLDTVLAGLEGGEDKYIVRVKKLVRPVVLCFGGQVGKSVGLDRGLYDATPLLRRHLDSCDALLKAAGENSIYPGIFASTPITDTVQLQTQLFALQYACARSWIDSGVEVTAVVGHSFGELTALCVSGVLSLGDALELIVRRAALIRDSWGLDPGAMMTVDGDREYLERALEGSSVDIACFNGPRSFTVAGSTSAIDALQTKLATDSALRTKRLDVTNAFHCSLVKPLIPALRKITDTLALHLPQIPVERATATGVHGRPPSNFIADHLRQSVYFGQAIQRLADRHGPSIWVEAGSNTGVTSMAKRALDLNSANHTFHQLQITTATALKNLTDTTLGLWKDHIPCSFWGHHPCQSTEYSPIFLPPYQFEKSRHWLENKPLPNAVAIEPEAKDEPLFSFVGYEDSLMKVAKFRLHTSHPRYVDAVTGHVAARTAPIAPASVLLDYAVEALRFLSKEAAGIPSVHDVASDAPLCLDSNREVWMEFMRDENRASTWRLKFYSEGRRAGSESRLIHCTVRMVMHDPSAPELETEFTRYERLVSHDRCLALLSDPDVDDILQGRNVYRTFAEVVEYSEMYRGVQKLVGKGNESAGRVVKAYSGETWADPFLCDSFSQVGGFWVNCMTDRAADTIYIASGMEQWMRTPRYASSQTKRPTTWEVWARHQRGEGHYTSDIFVFGDGKLAEVFLGLRYTKVPKAVFSRMLGVAAPRREEEKQKKDREQTATGPSLSGRVKVVVADFCAVEVKEIHNDSRLADAGVDSLMAMELARELEGVFQCTLAVTDLLEADTFGDLLLCVRLAVGDDSYDASSCISTTTSITSASTGNDKVPTPESLTSISDAADLQIPYDLAIEAFRETKAQTDKFLEANKCSGRLQTFGPLQIQLCVVLTLEAFEALGSNIRGAQPKQRLERISFDPQHAELVEYLYARLVEARLIELEGRSVIRTRTPAPSRHSTAILDEIASEYPEYVEASRLAFYTGSRLALVLRGEQDGLQLVFGTAEGQQRVSWMYGDEPHNVAGYKLMGEFIRRVVDKLQVTGGGPLKILEMGAGTGGGTKWFLPLLAALPVPVEYTFSDISPAFLAQARRKFREYPFIRYCTHDIEKPPADELVGTQHIIIASNAVHATSNLQESTRHMRRALRPDGVVMMLEMTQPVFAIDLVFGLFRGWWVFNDGRTHAITNEARWEKDLHAVGYGHVDWTDGKSNEVSVQRVIFATAQGAQKERLPVRSADADARWRAVEGYVKHSIEGFTAPIEPSGVCSAPETCILVTGGTGSLGSHLVSHLLRLSAVKGVVCLNRVGKGQALQQQGQAFKERKLGLTVTERAKLKVFESHTEERCLGLSTEQYRYLQQHVTHIVHNAWPMNGAKPLSSFEGQFRVVRNLADLARDIASTRPRPVRFQFVSSIGTVGGNKATEMHACLENVLCNGYSEAKYVCERIIHETLHQYPNRFQATIVRPGQIAGSATSGYWNSAEHFPAMVRSSQTLGVFPSLNGTLAWTPVDIVAGVMSDLLLDGSEPQQVYHIDHPVGQDWGKVVDVFARELALSKVPFADWVQQVKAGGGAGNPAGAMANWLEENFEGMSCRGGMDTRETQKRSARLREMREVGEEVVRKYVGDWKARGFLS